MLIRPRSFGPVVVLAVSALLALTPRSLAAQGLSIYPNPGSVKNAANTSGLKVTFNVINTGSSTIQLYCGATGPVTCRGSGNPSPSSVGPYGNLTDTLFYSVGAAGSGKAIIYTSLAYGKVDTAYYNVQVVSASPDSVTPAHLADTVPADGGLDSVSFQVKNTGNTNTDVYQLTYTCTTVSCPTTGNPNPAGPLTLGAGASSNVWLKFYHPPIPLNGSVKLTATDTSGVYTSTGTTQVVGRGPSISLAPYSSGFYPATDGVVYQHSTPAVGTMGSQQTLTLVYNSATVRPTALVTVDVSNVAAGPYPSVYELKVKLIGGAYLHLLNNSDSVFYTAGTTSPTRMVAAIDAKANGLGTGEYPVLVQVTAFYASSALTDTISSRILVNDQSASPFGAGVGLAGAPRLYTVSGSYGLLLVDGSGSAAYFDRTCSGCSFVSPAGVSSTLAANGSNYRLTALDGSFYDFNSSGLVLDHYALPNVEDLVFTWTGTQLSYLTNAATRLFTLNYSGGYLTGITDFAGRTTGVTITGGQLRAVTDPDGLADSVAYRSDSLLNRLVNRAGGVTAFVYDSLRELQSDSGPAAKDYTGATKWPKLVTTWAAAVVWQAATPGTSAGAPKANVRPDTVKATIVDPLADTTRVARDRFGNLTLVVGALRDTMTVTRDTLGNALVAVVPNGHKTVALYSGYLLIARNDSTAGQYLTFTYDSSTSNRLETVRGGPVRLDYFYNTASDPGATGALKLEYAGDTQGSGVWPPAGGDSLAHHFADAYGRDTLVRDGLGHTTKWSYAATGSGGNLIQATDAAGHASTSTYNGYGLPATTTVPMRGTDSLFYDVLGRDTLAVNPLAGRTRTGYSALGITRLTDAKGQVYKFDMNAWGQDTASYDLGDTTKADVAGYDVAGNVRTVRTRRGDTITIAYDSLGRLVRRAGPDFPAESLFYCPKGRCLVAMNANGRDSIVYDSLGRTRSVVQWLPDTLTRDTILYTYDAQSRLVTRQSPSGTAPLATSRWIYNAISGALDTLCLAGACASYRRDYELKPDTITYHPGYGSWWQAYLYNSLHLPTLQFFSLAADSMFRLHLFYDSLGRPDTLQPYSDVNPHTKYLSYDALGRLTNDCSYNGSPYCWNEYNYFQPAYRYDSAGNDNLNGAVIAGNRYSTFSGYTLTYDANGAVVTKAGFFTPDTTWFTWNALGQLAVVVRDSGSNAQVRTLDSLHYDALGHRVAKTVNGTTTWFTYDGDRVIADRSGSGSHALLAEYGFDGEDLFAVRTPSDTLIALRSPTNGTVIGLARAGGGAIVKTYDVLGTPFGQQVPDTGFVLRYKMGSQEYDQETRLYHLGARYYDSQMHRFLSEDPSGIAAGLNLYTYVGDDPVSGRDPSGLFDCTVTRWYQGVPTEFHCTATPGECLAAHANFPYYATCNDWLAAKACPEMGGYYNGIDACIFFVSGGAMGGAGSASGSSTGSSSPSPAQTSQRPPSVMKCVMNSYVAAGAEVSAGLYAIGRFLSRVGSAFKSDATTILPRNPALGRGKIEVTNLPTWARGVRIGAVGAVLAQAGVVAAAGLASYGVTALAECAANPEAYGR